MSFKLTSDKSLPTSLGAQLDSESGHLNITFVMAKITPHISLLLPYLYILESAGRTALYLLLVLAPVNLLLFIYILIAILQQQQQQQQVCCWLLLVALALARSFQKVGNPTLCSLYSM